MEMLRENSMLQNNMYGLILFKKKEKEASPSS